jgi:Na+/H+ antiporter NhaD/arsenite permease-like protein
LNPAWLSLFALAFVIGVSGRERIGIGVLSLSLAWFVGHHFAGMTTADILAAFPVQLFIVLFGVTLFFGLASENGSLGRMTGAAVRLARGRFAGICAIFFLLAFALSTVGLGNVGAVALLAPFAMASASKSGMGTFVMTLILISGANTGAFSPFAPTGIIAGTASHRIGLELGPWTQIYLPNAAMHAFMALTFGAVFWPALKRRGVTSIPTEPPAAHTAFSGKQAFTLAAIAVFVAGTVVFRADVGFLAVSMAALLMLFDAGNAKMIAKVVPWNVLIMVCGVSTLVQVCETTGALSLFTAFLAKISHPSSAPAVLAWTAGMVSIYSSSSGVVLPTFVPLVPELIERMGGGSPAALVGAINVGSHVVDASPLSTLGALCVASAAPHIDRVKLFKRLLAWSIAMSFYGAFVCLVFFGLTQ